MISRQGFAGPVEGTLVEERTDFAHIIGGWHASGILMKSSIATSRSSQPQVRSRALAAEHDDGLIRRVKSELERIYGNRLERVLLYGSRARGDARPDSDYDLAVVLSDYDGGLTEVYRLADLSWEIEMETEALMSMKPFAPTNLNARTLFMHNLRSEGVPV